MAGGLHGWQWMFLERTGSFAISMLFIASCLAVGAGIVVWERTRELRGVGLVSKVSS